MAEAGFVAGNTMDFWCTDKPCWGMNGTTYHMGRNGQVVGDIEHYGDEVYTQEALRIIGKHNPSVPLFFYIAFQNNHEPLEAPDEYIEMYPASWRQDRRWYAAMTTYWDNMLGRITKKLKVKGMWNDTLMVLTTDNGGPTYWTTPDVASNWPPLVPGAKKGYAHGGGANNWPLRGSKVSNWEGGTRGTSFVSGGFLPAKVRGTILEQKLHVTDWYATFCHLAGVDPEDPAKEGIRSDGTKYPLPPIDSLNLWGLISGATAKSPRDEIPVCIDMPLMNGSSALIVGDFKLLLGPQQLSYWQGPAFPNGSNSEPYGRWPPFNMVDCGKAEIKFNGSVMQEMAGGCLFNIKEDPAETRDIAKDEPEMLAKLKQRYLALKETALDQRTPLLAMVRRTTLYHANWVRMLQQNRGFVGPWCTDGACDPHPHEASAQEALLADGIDEPIQPPYGFGGPFPGFPAYGPASWGPVEENVQDDEDASLYV